jgi:hypothetical protein
MYMGYRAYATASPDLPRTTYLQPSTGYVLQHVCTRLVYRVTLLNSYHGLRVELAHNTRNMQHVCLPTDVTMATVTM